MTRLSLLHLIWIAALLGATTAAQANEALAKKYACAACHQTERKLVGPAWKEVASKYADGSVTAAQLAATIKKGSAGKWGSMAMPAQSQLPDADAQTLAAWVLRGAK
jgi:cytochrome c